MPHRISVAGWRRLRMARGTWPGSEEYRSLIKGYMLPHKVRPGITGLAQASGCRGETKDLEDTCMRIEYDLDCLRCDRG
jgi:lipopolysaccharide/colanic/teichoic acid biosynthesis glycosyltransferase